LKNLNLTAAALRTPADVVITPAGQIDLIYARASLITSSGLVSLDGISYQP
jgi:hypothetical protein